MDGLITLLNTIMYRDSILKGDKLLFLAAAGGKTVVFFASVFDTGNIYLSLYMMSCGIFKKGKYSSFQLCVTVSEEIQMFLFFCFCLLG